MCVPVCGAIILNPTLDKCLLVKGWSKNATWGFPKGKINKNESEIACAAREVQEEVIFCQNAAIFCGFSLLLLSLKVGYDVSKLINEEDSITATINNNDQTMKLYIAAGVSEDTLFETQTRKEIRYQSHFIVFGCAVNLISRRFQQNQLVLSERPPSYQNARP